MNLEIISTIIVNLFLLFSLALIFSVYSILENIPKHLKTITFGLLIAVVGIASMIFSYEVTPGIIFDSRTVIIVVSGMFYGTIPTLISSVAMIAFRIYSGGSGVVPGVLEIVLASIIGLLFFHKRLKKIDSQNFKISALEIFIVMFLTQFVVIGIGYFFPNAVSPQIVNEIFLPMASINTTAGFLVSSYLIYQMKLYYKNQVLLDNQRLFSALFNISNSAVLVYNPSTKLFTNVNNQAINSYEYTKEEFLKLGIYDIDPLPKEDIDYLIELALNKELAPFKTKHITKTGVVHNVEINATAVLINQEPHVYFSSTDLTVAMMHKALLDQSKLQLNSIIENTNDGVILLSEAGVIETINKAGRSLLSVNKVVSSNTLQKLIQIKHPHYQSLADVITEIHSIKQPIHCKSAEINRKRMGDVLTIDISFYPLTNTENRYVGSVIIFRDVTIEIEHYNQVQFISQHDTVTELYNRRFLETEMHRLNTKRQCPISYIIGDINGLKLVNDAFGHQEGDLLLIEIAHILKRSTRSEDIVGRWGGDEFLIILPQTSNELAQKIVDRIHDLCDKSYYQTIRPSISLGVGTKVSEEDNVQDILLIAEKNMYDNKMTLGPKMRENTYQRLIEKLEEINPEFKNRIDRLLKVGLQFSKYLNLGSDDTDTIVKLAKNHEIGHITLLHEGVDSIESKRLHVENGYRILNAMPTYADISKYVLHHHENWDGTGYPERLSGEDIPVPSRLIRIIDCYDQLMYGEDSKTILNKEETLKNMGQKLSHELDPILGHKFIEMIMEDL